MKPYTDLEQSKKLAEILPIESADMTWVDGEWGEPIVGKIMKSPDEDYTFIPCWSLAALLAQIPNPILRRIDEGWQCEDSHGFNWVVFGDDPIDACVEMITILYKENEL